MIDPGLLSIFLLAGIGVFLVALMFLCRRRAPQEQGLSPAYESRCSGLAGAGTNLHNIRLSIYDHFLVIAFFTPHVILFSELANVAIKKFAYISYLRIELRNGSTYSLNVKDPRHVAELINMRSGAP
jgi:hypothetical protein